MKNAWLTYAWNDDASGDVEFVAQELIDGGVTVHLDRWDIAAGSRLWAQIASAIEDPARTDAWLLYATQASLASESCQEELAYALDRALRRRGDAFPIIGIFPGPLETDLVPPVIRVRLYVRLVDPDWKERVISAIEGRRAAIARPRVDPYEVVVHAAPSDGASKLCFEVRPRAGSWFPCVVAIPIAERDRVKPSLMPGPRGRPPRATLVMNARAGLTDDGQFWALWFDHEITPTQSVFVLCEAAPSRLRFGTLGAPTAYEVEIKSDRHP